LKHLLRLRKVLDYEGVRRFLEKWQPFGGLIYFHLLLDGLSEEGYLQVWQQNDVMGSIMSRE
jgi:hypothetical protein